MGVRKAFLSISCILIVILLLGFPNRCCVESRLPHTSVVALVLVTSISISIWLFFAVVWYRSIRERLQLHGLSTSWPLVYGLSALCSAVTLTVVLCFNLPYVLQRVEDLWLIALKVYLLTVVGYYVHAKLGGIGMGKAYMPFAASALAILVFFGCYISMASVFHLKGVEIKSLVSTGLAITYFNLGATVFSGKTPLDFKIVLPDGRRLLGDSVSTRGTIAGLLLSVLASTVAANTISRGVVAGPCAMLGDALAGFVKRRFGLPSGEPVIFLDQLDSIVLLLLLEARYRVLELGQAQLLVLTTATFLIPTIGNLSAFYLGKKDVPW